MNTRRNCFSLPTKLSMFLGAVSFMLPAGTAYSQTGYKFDAATVSGLPARNIGSATMSGRVAAVDAVDQDGRITVYLGAASGGGWKSVNGGTAYKSVVGPVSAPAIRAGAVY